MTLPVPRNVVRRPLSVTHSVAPLDDWVCSWTPSVVCAAALWPNFVQVPPRADGVVMNTVQKLPEEPLSIWLTNWNS